MNIEKRNSLVEDNMELIHFTIHKYVSKESMSAVKNIMDYDDLKQIGAVALINAAEKWEQSKGEFSTFATVCIRNDIYKAFEKMSIDKTKGKEPENHKELSKVWLDAPTDGDVFLGDTLGSCDESLERHELAIATKEAFEKVVEHYSEKDQKLLKKGFAILDMMCKDMQASEIAPKMDLDVPQVKYILKKTRKILKDNLEVLPFTPDME